MKNMTGIKNGGRYESYRKINSSARKNGNTSILIDTVFEELIVTCETLSN